MPPSTIRRRDAEDLIGGLPDELLHAILVRLPSAAAAARTSVLSRRWRGVWAHMPELVLGGSPAPSTTSSALLDSMDAALNSYAAPTVSSLKIDVRGVTRCDIHADRVAPWLRFASQRVAGKLFLSLKNAVGQRYKVIKGDLALPVCERATEMDLNLGLFWNKFVLRPPQTGCFAALTDLRIACKQMDGGELGRVVSSPQCPRLRKLCVIVLNLVPTSGVSMRSESLECLEYYTCSTVKLEVTAPMLSEVNLLPPDEACIIASKLEKLDWKGTYDPSRHQLVVANRHLQSLFIMHYSRDKMLKSSTRLTERFDTARSLTVSLGVDEGISGYVTFLKELDNLPVCENLDINLASNNHGLLPKMLYLLRRCRCIRKLKLSLYQHTPPLKISYCVTAGCPCLHPESHRSDDITLDSVEEIGISLFTGSAEQQEFIEVLLSRCNMVTLKRLDIAVSSTHVSLEIMEFIQRIRTMYSKVQLNVLTREVRNHINVRRF